MKSVTASPAILLRLCRTFAMIAVATTMVLLTGCDIQAWNAPYPKRMRQANVLFTSFAEQPKTLDTVKSYNANEYIFLDAIVEPMLTYDYLKRPYTLTPLTLTSMPTERYDAETDQTQYEFSLKPNIFYQPHPAFAKNKAGQYLYHHLSAHYLAQHRIHTLKDFANVGTRQLVANDYVTQIKRLADPTNVSPIYSFLSEHIVGFKDYSRCLTQHNAQADSGQPYQLSECVFEGITQQDPLHFSMRVYGHYPTFRYWLAMPFFSPIPWEALVFYQQPGMKGRNITLDWYPIGTGPFYMYENNPNRIISLERNPNFRTMYFPSEGSDYDKRHGYLDHAGQQIPALDAIRFSLERESIPRWQKFLQGYYDTSTVIQDSFDQAITLSPKGEASLTPFLQEKGIRLTTTIEPSVFYIGFNMRDPIVGGLDEAHRKLRQALAIAVDYEEYLAIFLNGRGKVAHGPIPPGIFGYQSGINGINRQTYRISSAGVERRPISDAKQLLAQAGYPNGVSAKTGKRLRLHFDTTANSGPEEKAYFTWLRKQGHKLGIEINIRATHYNRFQDKMRHGKTQLYNWGWHADYPDPENFLSLFLTDNKKSGEGGVNSSNYSNPVYDQLFQQMMLLKDSPQRAEIINRMVHLLQKDSPWLWGVFPKQLTLSQSWISATKPMTIGSSSIRYISLDPTKRYAKQNAWNQPDIQPFLLLSLTVVLLVLVIMYHYYQAQYRVRHKLGNGSKVSQGSGDR